MYSIGDVINIFVNMKDYGWQQKRIEIIDKVGNDLIVENLGNREFWHYYWGPSLPQSRYYLDTERWVTMPYYQNNTNGRYTDPNTGAYIYSKFDKQKCIETIKEDIKMNRSGYRFMFEGEKGKEEELMIEI